MANNIIEGTITGSVSGGLQVQLVGAAVAFPVCDEGGHYQVDSLNDGNYIITPIPYAGVTFTPDRISASVTGGETFVADFVASGTPVPPVKVSGTVSGTVVSGLTVHLLGPHGTSTTTDANGHYEFASVAPGYYAVMMDTVPGLSFTPQSVSFLSEGEDVELVGITVTGEALPPAELLPIPFVVKEFEIGTNANGLQDMENFINFYCSGATNNSLTDIFLTSRNGATQAAVVLTNGQNGHHGLGIYQVTIRLAAFEILHDSEAPEKIASWLRGLSSICYPSVIFNQVYERATAYT